MNSQPINSERFVIDPETLVMYDAETKAVFVYVPIGKEVCGE